MNETPIKPKKKAVAAVGPRLKHVLRILFGLFALLTVNSLYLSFVSVAGPTYQNWFYLNMFLLHLVLGLLIVIPTIVFGLVHLRNTRDRKNRVAVKVGYVLFAAALVLLGTGFVLARFDILGTRFEINNPLFRGGAYWLHVICSLVVIWLFVVHRLAGPRIRWRVGGFWAAVALVFALGLLILQRQDPRAWNQRGPESGAQYFAPSLARTTTGAFLPAETLQNDAYCRDCHTQVHASWSQSAHRFSSFNNPIYAFSVKQTRAKLMARDGNVHASRFCAGCHDPVPFFSGAFDEPRFDDPNYDLSQDPMAQAGITCTVCHSISNINSPRGNSDFTIDEPVHYPFAFSDSALLMWTNHQLIKAKPAFHKATFLKPLHKSSEFCGSCHKVHLPKELNDYKWLRGQNHYDSFWLSGVSGHGLTSFYYPKVAEPNCNGCHMPLEVVDDSPNFGAKVRDDSGQLKTMDHLFPSANTALPALLPELFADPAGTIKRHQLFLQDKVRIDLFGIKPGGRIEDPLLAPLGQIEVQLEPGQTYLLETVVRTLKLGHLLTEGTADSNELWLELVVKDGDRVLGHSGALNDDGGVDPWSHFINAFVLDREGKRIDRRNAEDIFVPLYNHQIPPGAADVIHYSFTVPKDQKGPLTVEARLNYRKFDATMLRLATGKQKNELPITVLATDTVTFSVGEASLSKSSEVPAWQRWNDYGIGLLLKPGSGEKRQAAAAFAEVEALGQADGALNQARVWIAEGLVQEQAPLALARADKMGANQWQLLWFGALVAQANGDLDRALANLTDLLKGGFSQAKDRNFDFSKDYRLLAQIGNVAYQKGLAQSGGEREASMKLAQGYFEQVLVLDPENLAAHWGLFQAFRDLGDKARAQEHAEAHARYKPDDNARDSAVAKARLRYPAANHASESVVIYDLQRTSLGGPSSP